MLINSIQVQQNELTNLTDHLKPTQYEFLTADEKVSKAAALYEAYEVLLNTTPNNEGAYTRLGGIINGVYSTLTVDFFTPGQAELISDILNQHQKRLYKVKVCVAPNNDFDEYFVKPGVANGTLSVTIYIDDIELPIFDFPTNFNPHNGTWQLKTSCGYRFPQYRGYDYLEEIITHYLGSYMASFGQPYDQEAYYTHTMVSVKTNNPRPGAEIFIIDDDTHIF